MHTKRKLVVVSFILVASLALAGRGAEAAPPAGFSVPQSDTASISSIIVKFKPRTASHIETLLPARSLRVVDPKNDATLQNFFQKYSAQDLQPLYKDLIREKKLTGKSESALFNELKNKFAARANQAEPQTTPPTLGSTYIMHVDSGTTQEQFQAILNKLKNDSNVEFAEPDARVHADMVPNDPHWLTSTCSAAGDLYGLRKISADAAWDSATGSGKTVAIIDTGVDYTHEDLSANMWTNTREIPGNGIDDDGNGYIDDVQGWNFVSNTNNPMDDYGHGTHVAGTVAAVGNNNVGVIGTAFGAHIMPVKVLDSTGYGTWSAVANGVRYAANSGANVINMSLSGGYTQVEDDAVAYARSLGVVVVAAAGNSNLDLKDSYPANLPGVIAVAATDSNDQKASFSNWGQKVDVAAPGVNIESTGWGNATWHYRCMSGTSMATPHVAGLAALILSKNPTFTNDQVQQVIRGSATDIGTAGFDIYSGYGRVNAQSALVPTTASAALITWPYNGIALTSGLRYIYGTVGGPNFASYRLEVGAGTTPTSWTVFATGSAPVTNGVIGTLDTTTLTEEIDYVVRLTVTDTLGNSFYDRVATRATTPPTVNIASPVTNARVTGTVPITGTASDNVSVSKVEVSVDYGAWNLATGTTNWTWNWPTPANNYQVHTIQARATDNFGTTTTATITVVVESVPPTVSLTAPASGATVSGANVSVTATASDNIGVAGVRFQLDGANIGVEDTTSPYSIVWDTRTATNGSHTLTAIARDTTGNTATSSAVAVTVLNDITPPVISAVAAGGITAGGATITWTTDELSDSQVEYGLSTAYGSFTTLNATLVTSHSQSLTGLMDATTYHFRVRSKDASGNQAVGLDNTFQTLDGTPPSVPNGLTATAASGTSVNLSWTASTDNVGVTGYRIYRNSALVATLGAVTTYTDAGLTDATTYSYQVSALDAANNESARGTTVSVTTPDVTAPSTPTNVTAIAGAGTSVNLSWTASTDNVGVTGYRVYRNSTLLATLGAVTSYTDTSVTVGTTYSYQVSALDATGNASALSLAASVTVPDTTPPSSPTGLTATAASGTSVNLSWTAATDNVGVTGYHVYRNATLIATLGAVTTYTDTGLTDATTYTYQVDAFDAAGNTSAHSGSVSVTTPDVTAPTVSVTAPLAGATVSGTTTVSATASDNVSVAGVQFKLDGVNLGAEVTVAPYTVSWNTTTAVNGTHTLTAVARDAAGNTTTSALVSVTVSNPPVISSVATSSVTGSGATITWVTDRSSDSQVEYGLTTTYGSLTTLDPTFLTNHTVMLSGLTDATTYHFRVRSRDGSGVLAVSVDSTFQTPDVTAPSTPTNVTAIAGAGTSVNLSWSASTDNVSVTGYRVYRNSVLLTTLGVVTSYTDTSVTVGTTYSYQVSALDAAGNASALSLAASVTVPDTTPPSSPTGLTATAASGTSVNLSWTASTDNVGVTGYHVYRNSTLVATLGAVLTYTDSGLTDATTYSYQVDAFDAAGNTSARSLGVNATTPDITAPTVSVTAPTAGATVSGTTTVSATASDNVSVSGVQFKLDGVNLGTEVTVSPYTVSWNTTTATNGSHTVTAVARDAAGNNTTSASVSVTVSNSALACVTPPSGIVSWWSGDNTVADVYARNNGTLVSGATYGAGQVQNGFLFDGANSYVDAGAGSSLNLTGDYSMEMWVKPTINSTSFHAGWNYFSQKGYKNEFGFYGTSGPTFKPYNASGTAYSVSASMPFTAGQWYHVTGVRSGSFVGIYVNGVLKSSRNDFTGTLGTSASSQTIGGRSTAGNSFNGTLDEASIYNRGLSLSEVQSIYNAGVNGKCRP